MAQAHPSAIEPTAIARDRSLLPVKVMVALFLLLKLCFDVAVPPINDEAYYWLWGQRPALSYFDHPPLHAWLQGIVSLLFGWNLASLRLLTWLTLAGTLAIFWAWATRIAPADPARWFWYAAAVYLASPVVMAMTTIAFHDHLMLFLCFASAFAFFRFAEGWESGEPRFRLLYLSSALLGLAVLTKYNAVFLGLGYAIAILLRPRLRTVLATPHAYLAALLGIALQAPVLVWNLTEGFASYKFHLVERAGNGYANPTWEGAYVFLRGQLFWLSPFLIWPILRFAISGRVANLPVGARTVAIGTLIVSLAVMTALAFFVDVLPYWTVVGYALPIVFAAGVVGTGVQFWGHMAIGLAFTGVMLFNLAVLPIAILFGNDDWGSSVLYGWPEVAAAVSAAQAGQPGSFVAATHYNLAAPLGYALKTPEVASFSTRADQFDFWSPPAAARGRDAIILADRIYGVETASAEFRAVRPLGEIAIEKFGYPLHTFLLYLGEDYLGPAPAAP